MLLKVWRVVVSVQDTNCVFPQKFRQSARSIGLLVGPDFGLHYILLNLACINAECKCDSRFALYQPICCTLYH